jgi:hypothetical protein
MKYLFTAAKLYKSLFNTNPQPTGSYLWFKVLNGEINTFKEVEDFEKYDVIHMNVTLHDMPCIRQLAEKLKNSSTKLVLNQDHAPQIWGQAYTSPWELAKIFDLADASFATTPEAQSMLQIVAKKKIHLMPHPCETHILKKLRFTSQANHAAILYNKYDNPVVHPWFAFTEMGIKTALIGYVRETDPRTTMTEVLFNSIYPEMSFPDYLRLLGESKMMFEPSTMFRYGRGVLEAACLKVPVAGSDSVEAMRRLFPNTCGNVYNMTAMREGIKKIWTNDDFSKEISNFAYDEVDYYGFKQSKERFMAMLEGSK